jgi:hypothetical protein
MASTDMNAEVLQQMLDENYEKKMHRYASKYDAGNRQGKSPVDIANDAHNSLYDMLSEPLKKMQVAYLNKVADSCYKEKHMADDVPNEEQIKLCRDRTHERIFGKFVNRTVDVRDSNFFHYGDCL